MEFFNIVTNAITGEVTQVPFTKKEIEEYNAKIIEIQKTAYIAQRVAEYPLMSEYLDGIVKGNQEQIQKYINDCLAVKAKYPK